MPLRYYNIPDKQTPYEQYRQDQQASINDLFDSSATLYTLQQEENPGTQTYTDLQVRLVQAINSETGQKLGDDYRKLIFKDGTSNPVMGKRYSFEDNIWLTVNTDNYAHYTFNSTLVRCQSTINWFLENGNIHREPIALNYQLKNTSFMVKKVIDAKDGNTSGVLQYNDLTKNIDINDVFIMGFGEGAQAYKVTAVYSALAQETMQNTPKLIKIDFEVYNENTDQDDLINRLSNPIPDYEMSVDQESITQLVGYQTQLTATVKNDDEIVSRTLEWSTSDDSIVSVDSSTGEINLLSVGSATITASLSGNQSVSDSITVEVVSSLTNDFEVRILPDETFIRQGFSQTYSVYLYNNNVQQPNTFVITASGVPSENYSLNIIDGNNFEVSNVFQYDGGNLQINCVSGGNSKTIEIELGGVW